ncbi:kinesin motor domain containing protein [Stylonychia lemnae]|uniref:Kinesin-like protein n=1 Tax=Stylonychia lemnae TaxID=5949 RepID=A0A078A4E0_STYLE|nr:kinesin motor domain containing protein [Stylonychia lemnae]|eukprot:CDW75634.1 kinesin motor domain containing protein [Stylonychia lemnae]
MEESQKQLSLKILDKESQTMQKSRIDSNSHRFSIRTLLNQRFLRQLRNLCLDGYNGTIFAYGQTGSGKTYSMSGGDTWNQRGIVPRVFTYLFDEIRQRSQQSYTEYNVYVSYFEIYNENGYDLLDRKHAELQFDKWNKISLYEDNSSNLHLKNLTIHTCRNEQDAIDLLMMGNFIRQVSATPMNPASSRSHCIFTIAIESKDLTNDIIRTSKLHLVDLAGSERVYKSDPDSQIKTEAKYINRSLSYLEQVIIALHEKAKGTRVHVPYRNSMMTSILRDSLGGNCKTVMIANMSPDIENEEESVSTARFAQRCAKLINEVRVNEVLDLNTMVQRLETENHLLKVTVQKSQMDTPQRSSEYHLELGAIDSEQTINTTSGKERQSNHNHQQSFSNTINNNQLRFLDRDLNQEEIIECEKAASEYICNDSFEIELHNLNEVNEYFRIFKDEVIKRDLKYQKEISDLKGQINLLKTKVENGCSVSDKRQSNNSQQQHEAMRFNKPFQNENMTVLSQQQYQINQNANKQSVQSLGYPQQNYLLNQSQKDSNSSSVLKDINNNQSMMEESPYSYNGYVSENNMNMELENKITQLINQKKASLISPPNQTFGKAPKNFGETNQSSSSCSTINNHISGGPIGPQLHFVNLNSGGQT